ncbi:hypothetical protein Gasu2_37970 [Galdieria sulphuraria]|uniref:Protein xylosyltransferase n=1 Tax=Galdieria sulphuraria TaxID=130081 RepID=M2X6I1_GALSU|nr:uncharacterized protein Gasu_05430 [Galdieria sulphuraria]EME32125.1 hypothetical protein Gasu_05430 [Galdieria sulphuraria]GJD09551.1 hypothetical protein Gasu2_37970 [Galdieria sulphuraria]|eukprot:XP_005708645.1 hypothetical protein Gasu_05430 [Galdieria sulphuraria]
MNGVLSYAKFPETESLLRAWKGSENLVPRIGFLFLSKDGIEFEELWRAWFRGNEEKALVLIHCDKCTDSETSDWLNEHRTSVQVNTAWGHPNLTKAMILLLNEAFAQDSDGRIAKVVFLSDKCVPLQSFDGCYRLLLSDPYCWLHRTVDQLPQLVELPKASQWIALNRDALIVAKNFTLFEYYSDMVYIRKAAEWNLLTDEFYFANLLVENQMWVQIQNRTMTWLKWTNGSSPVTFSSVVDLESVKELLFQAKLNGVLFARKFLRSTNYEALGLHHVPFLVNKSSISSIPTPYISNAGIII